MGLGQKSLESIILTFCSYFSCKFKFSKCFFHSLFGFFTCTIFCQTFLYNSRMIFIIYDTRGRGHYVAGKEDCSYEINAYLFSFSHCVSLFSVCYQATNVSPSCPCVTVKQMLVQGFCVLLVTHGRFTYRRINGHTDRQTDRQLTLYSRIICQFMRWVIDANY